MPTSKIFLVFVLPAIFSMTFASFVMAEILQNPDREVTTPHQADSHTLEIMGLARQYTVSEPVSVQVRVNDRAFDCGDLYITIYEGEKPASQRIFLNQCIVDSNTLPVDDMFSELISTPGSYRLVAQVISTNLDSVSAEGVFIVR